MLNHQRELAERLARQSEEHPFRVLGLVAIITLAALPLAAGLEMRTNVVEMLPTHSPVVQSYLEVIERFGEANTIVVLEGDRDRMVEMARDLVPRLRELELLYVVQGELPVGYFLDHGFMLMDESDFDRSLDRLNDPTLLGTLRGLNDDFEREYADNEENLERDEVEIAQSMHGVQRSLEILAARFAGEPYATVEEAADAMLVGDPWILSLDRRMMLILCTPRDPLIRIDTLLEMTDQVERVLDEIRPGHPQVEANLTGMAPLQRDEMDSITTSTQILSTIALLLIYLMLARNFGGWILPIVALAPLVLGIFWTMGALGAIYGALNMFTMMIMLILLGLGIDFAIHLITRFYEERSRGGSTREALLGMIAGSGVGVLTGGLTTAAAFFALTIGDTQAMSELGLAAGVGIVLTLIAMFLTLPPLLALRDRRLARRNLVSDVPGAREGWPALGRIAALSWRQHWLFLGIMLVVSAASYIGARNNETEYDWLELEPKGLENVRLQREIPERFGITDQGAWIIVDTIEESRALKEEVEQASMVGDVSAISDFLPTTDRFEQYAGKLRDYRTRIAVTVANGWRSNSSDGELATEVDRLWDNLDLMSNLAFAGGLDRVVRSIDRLTGYDNETDTTDRGAVLPTLVGLLESGVDPAVGADISRRWYAQTRANLLRMGNPEPFGIEALPDEIVRTMLPRDGGEGYLVNISAREYIWDTRTLELFSAQVERVNPRIVGTAKLSLEFIAEMQEDARDGVLLAVAVILVLLMIHFRSPAGLLAIIPLAAGALLMVGVMYLTGLKYNYMNFLTVPIIIGIGIDDGVHALHRFREEKSAGSERVFNAYRFVGRAILLTSLTTMIGFGSLGFYEMPSMASFGLVLFYGVGACFVTTLLFLPATLRLFLGRGTRKAAPVAAVTALLLLAAVPPPVAAQDEGAAWLKRIADTERVPHSYGVMRQTITTSSGALRTLTMRAWSAQEGDVGLMAYTEPARVAGDKILQLNGGDDIWYYMKRRDTTRHFVGHTRRQSAMGSDFSYEDLASGDVMEDYTAEVLGFEDLEDIRCVKLKCTPTPSGPSYDHIVLWAGEDDALTRRIEYYDEDGHLKTLFLSEFREVEDRTVATKMEMVNHREDSRTIIETLEITFAQEPEAWIFTKAALTRRIP
jgi:predicted RND superfamily exporter protein